MSHSAQQALSKAEAILFDFDGIILDTEWPIYETWKNLFAREGHPLPLEIYVKCIGSDFDSSWSPEKYLEDLTGKTFNWDKENADRQVEIVEAVGKLAPMPGVSNLLEKLGGHKKAVVSSSSHHWVDGWLDKLELTPHFDTIVCRGDAPKIKPAPDLYLEAAKRLNVTPSACLVIEDSYNGMIAAHAAKIPVIAVPNRLTSNIDFSQAEYTISSLEGLT